MKHRALHHEAVQAWTLTRVGAAFEHQAQGHQVNAHRLRCSTLMTAGVLHRVGVNLDLKHLEALRVQVGAAC